MREAPEGYKRTEAGVIPEDWDMVRIDTNASIKTGAKNTQDKQNDGQYPFFVRSQGVERINSYSYDGEAVLTAGDGVGTGKVFHYIKGRFDAHQRVYRIADFSNRLDGRYFYYQFSTMFYDRIMSMTAKSSVDSVRLDMIANMQIPLPSFPEQCASAEALSDVDSLIKSSETLIAKKRAIKQASMQQLLTGKTRLPGFSGKRKELNMARDSILKARIGWQGLTSAEYLTTGNYYLVTGTDFLNGRVDWSTCHFVDRSRFNQDINIQLAPDDVLLTKDGTIGKAGFIDSLPGPATLNSGVFVIRPKKKSYFPKYMYYILTSHIFSNFLGRLQAGSTIVHLYQKDFSNFSFNAPPIDEQVAIVTVLSDLDTEIASLEQRLDKTRAIKQGMMQQLLTGHIRLVKPQAAAEESATTRTSKKGHSPQFNEAVVISMLAKHFGSEEFPLGRMRCTKLSYLLHRRIDGQVEGYLKKAAGPYKPSTRYGGAEKIALQNDYIRKYKSGKHQGFIASTNIEAAERYFCSWYGSEILQWLLDKFRYEKNEHLELLTTVDMAAEELG